MNSKNRQSRDLATTLGCGLISIVVLLIAGAFVYFNFLAGPGPYAIKPTYVRDWLYSPEPRINNSNTIWVRNSEFAAYCTFDKTVLNQAKRFLEWTEGDTPQVLVFYRSINVNDAEMNRFNTGDGCARDTGATLYKLLAVCLPSEYAAGSCGQGILEAE